MSSRWTKPAPPHNRLQAPGVCMCVGCCRIILTLRCSATSKGSQCGGYKGHRGDHSLLPATAFQIAEERIRLDAATQVGVDFHNISVASAQVLYAQVMLATSLAQTYSADAAR